MEFSAPSVTLEPSINWRRAMHSVAGLGILWLLLVMWLVLQSKWILAGLAIAGPLAVVLLGLPRQLILIYPFLLFIADAWSVIPGFSLLDGLAMLLIMTALLNGLLHPNRTQPRPAMAFNYVALLVILVIAGLFGQNFGRSVFPLMRVALLFASFLAVYRLAGYVRLIELIRVFFWTCVAHAAVAAVPLVMNIPARSFGLVPTVLDDMTALALPVGLILYFWSGRRESVLSLMGTAVILAALLGTQSRASILFGLLAAALAVSLTLLLCWKRDKRTAGADPNAVLSRLVSGRLKTLVLAGLIAGVLAVLFRPEAVGAIFGRFERLLTTSPADTVRLRIVLWERAIQAFLDHPILGLGPGNFRQYQEIYSTAHLEPLNYYVRGLSAHSPLLHYLAEAGLIGGVALAALFANHLRIAGRIWTSKRLDSDPRIPMVILTLAALFLVTIILEGGWMWRQTGSVAAFFLAITARAAAGGR